MRLQFNQMIFSFLLLVFSVPTLFAQNHSSFTTGTSASNSSGTLHSTIGASIVPQSFVSNGTSRLADGFLAVPIFSQTVGNDVSAAATYGDESDTIHSSGTYSSNDSTVAAVLSTNTFTIIQYKGAGNAKIAASAPQSYLTLPAVDTISLTVEKALLMIVGDTIHKKVGDDDPEFTVSYMGFVNGEDSGVLTTMPVAVRIDKGETYGTYPITFSGADAKNYEISYSDGVLIIAKATEVIADTNLVNIKLPKYAFAAVNNPVKRSAGKPVELLLTVPGGATAKVMICDALGNALPCQDAEIKPHNGENVRRFLWDMKNAKGNLVTSGAYLAVAYVTGADGTQFVRKCMIGIKE